MEYVESNIKVTIRLKDDALEPFETNVFINSKSYDEAIEKAQEIVKQAFGRNGITVKVESGLFLTDAQYITSYA